MACQAGFTVVRRRHHCRNCGKVFCGRCSSNNVPLPRYGHTKPVRVCNRCFLYQVTPFTVSQVMPTSWTFLWSNLLSLWLFFVEFPCTFAPSFQCAIYLRANLIFASAQYLRAYLRIKKKIIFQSSLNGARQIVLLYTIYLTIKKILV